MALSQKQKTETLFYLGYPGLTIVQDSTHYSGIIDDRLEAASVTPEICAMVIQLLKKIKNFDDCLEKAKCRLAASKVDNITMNKDEIMMLNKERRRCIKELADLIAVNYRGRSNVIGVCN